MSFEPLKASVAHFDRLTGPRSSNDGPIVVIDVLRATTVIVCALANGAREIIPVSDPEAARLLARSGDGALLGGEQHNRRIAGFDFGNSPDEYDARVSGKTVIMHTTNGTRVLDALRGGKLIWCGAFANASTIARALCRPDILAVAFVCAGQDEGFSLEDFVCAGACIDAVSAARETLCDDEAIAARELFRGHRASLAALLRMGNHAKALEIAGLGADVAFSTVLDRYDVLPKLENGRITASRLD